MTTATELEAKITPAMMTKVVFVKDHSIHFVEAGWDVVLETSTDEEIAQAIGRARTLTGAVNEVRKAIVAPWICRNLEAREGSDSDEILTTARRLHDELTENWWDATARLNGTAALNRKPPKAEYAALGFSIPAAPVEVEVDLTNEPTATDPAAALVAEVAKATPKPRARKAPSGRQAPSTQTDTDDAAPAAKAVRRRRQTAKQIAEAQAGSTLAHTSQTAK